MKMVFPKWKEYLVYFVCLFGVMFALPNFLPKHMLSSLPEFMSKQVSLGLDLSGGVHLLLEADLSVSTQDYMNQTLYTVRDELRKAKIAYDNNFPKNIEKDITKIEFNLANDSQSGKAKGVLSAIDKSGIIVNIAGTKVTMQLTENAIDENNKRTISKAIEVVRRRVDETGTREASIQKQGENRIILQIPGIQDPAHVKELLGKTAKMTFRIVDESAPEILKENITPAPAGSVYIESQESGKMIAVKRQILLGGETLVDAGVTGDLGRPQVSFRFNTNGAKKFGEITKENSGKRLAIVLDDKIISAPVINEPIMGGAGVINSDRFTMEEANNLALLLRAGALPAPLIAIEERTVGPDLGADSIKSGVVATIMSIIFVVVFMILWYTKFGMIANIAVIVNLLILLACMSLLQATLTLPGIAGIALTVGTAVDANVLINERIKEELRKGVKIFKAVESGYDLAMATIVDTNLNTLIGMFCLYQFGTGPVKGFAITTALGTIISFFTATTLTRFIISKMIEKRIKFDIPT